jgi:rhodanese-related sulfurtransferase
MKTVKEYLAEANKMVPKLSVGEAIAWHETAKGIFIDIRDGLTIKNTEPIPGALHIPHGFIAFAADGSTNLHYSTLKRDSTIVLMCMAGGPAALRQFF